MKTAKDKRLFPEPEIKVETAKQINTYDNKPICPECGNPYTPNTNPELDQPDSEGWWWFTGLIKEDVWDVHETPVYIYKGLIDALSIHGNYEVSDFKGTWIKAIVPSFKGE